MTGAWTLRVSRMAAIHVPKMDIVGKCDPYVKVAVGGVERKTCKVKNACQAQWTEAFEFSVVGCVSEAVVTLMDWDRLGKDEVVGSVSIPLDVLISGAQQEQQVAIQFSFLDF